jgi:hypothetical protein
MAARHLTKAAAAQHKGLVDTGDLHGSYDGLFGIYAAVADQVWLLTGGEQCHDSGGV